MKNALQKTAPRSTQEISETVWYRSKSTWENVNGESVLPFIPFKFLMKVCSYNLQTQRVSVLENNNGV